MDAQAALNEIDEIACGADFAANLVSFKSTLSEVAVPSLYFGPQRATEFVSGSKPG